MLTTLRAVKHDRYEETIKTIGDQDAVFEHADRKLLMAIDHGCGRTTHDMLQTERSLASQEIFDSIHRMFNASDDNVRYTATVLTNFDANQRVSLARQEVQHTRERIEEALQLRNNTLLTEETLNRKRFLELDAMVRDANTSAQATLAAAEIKSLELRASVQQVTRFLLASAEDLGMSVVDVVKDVEMRKFVQQELGQVKALCREDCARNGGDASCYTKCYFTGHDDSSTLVTV
ncbi:MAG: hypothetical protein CMK92_03385 [Pseudomonas sp.]|nr:hypothetical protein [Pseudomonas sp.]